MMMMIADWINVACGNLVHRETLGRCCLIIIYRFDAVKGQNFAVVVSLEFQVLERPGLRETKNLYEQYDSSINFSQGSLIRTRCVFRRFSPFQPTKNKKKMHKNDIDWCVCVPCVRNWRVQYLLGLSFALCAYKSLARCD